MAAARDALPCCGKGSFGMDGNHVAVRTHKRCERCARLNDQGAALDVKIGAGVGNPCPFCSHVDLDLHMSYCEAHSVVCAAPGCGVRLCQRHAVRCGRCDRAGQCATHVGLHGCAFCSEGRQPLVRGTAVLLPTWRASSATGRCEAPACGRTLPVIAGRALLSIFGDQFWCSDCVSKHWAAVRK